MSYSAMAWARSIKTGSATVKSVLLAVANYADEEGICWPSQEQLADDTELSRHSIMRALDQLEDMGLMSRDRRHRKDGSRTSDLITLDLSSTQQRSSEQRSTQQQPKSHGATAEQVIEPSIPSPSARASKSKGEEQLAFDAYNDLAAEAGLPKAQALNDQRKAKIRQRLGECGGLAGWLDALGKIRGSPFLRGENDRGWKASLDFVLQQSSFTRLMEGSYDQQSRSRISKAKPTIRNGIDILDAVTDEAISRANGHGPEGGEEDPFDLPGLRQSAA
mgnify:CR=1 FL=1